VAVFRVVVAGRCLVSVSIQLTHPQSQVKSSFAKYVAEAVLLRNGQECTHVTCPTVLSEWSEINDLNLNLNETTFDCVNHICFTRNRIERSADSKLSQDRLDSAATA